MRPSPWDLIAPAYWTDEQAKALSDTHEKRHLTLQAIRLRQRKRRARRAILTLAHTAVLLFVLVFSRSDLEVAYTYWAERLPWLPTWPLKLGSMLPSSVQLLMGLYGLVFLVAAGSVFVAGSDVVAPQHRQARSLRVYLARMAVRNPSLEIEDLLAADLNARRQLWSRKLAENVSNAALVDRAAPLRVLTLFAIGSTMIFFGLGLHSAIGDRMEVVIPAAAVLLISVYWTAAQTPVRRVRIHQALRTNRCPRCGYDLSSTPPAIEPARLGGHNIGPERCAECGSLWPLLPPPLSPTGCPLPPGGPADPATQRRHSPRVTGPEPRPLSHRVSAEPVEPPPAPPIG